MRIPFKTRYFRRATGDSVSVRVQGDCISLVADGPQGRAELRFSATNARNVGQAMMDAADSVKPLTNPAPVIHNDGCGESVIGKEH